MQRYLANMFIDLTHTATHVMNYACHVKGFIYDGSFVPSHSYQIFVLVLQIPDIDDIKYHMKYEKVRNMLHIPFTASVYVGSVYLPQEAMGIGVDGSWDKFLDYIKVLSNKYPFDVAEELIAYTDKIFTDRVYSRTLDIVMDFSEGYGRFSDLKYEIGTSIKTPVCGMKQVEFAEDVARILGIDVNKAVPSYQCIGNEEFRATYIWSGRKVKVTVKFDFITIKLSQ
jgi:hypothetical protein